MPALSQILLLGRASAMASADQSTRWTCALFFPTESDFQVEFSLKHSARSTWSPGGSCHWVSSSAGSETGLRPDPDQNQRIAGADADAHLSLPHPSWHGQRQAMAALKGPGCTFPRLLLAAPVPCTKRGCSIEADGNILPS